VSKGSARMTSPIAPKRIKRIRCGGWGDNTEDTAIVYSEILEYRDAA
jgi:hypothetical protein